jgi:hypothetical protein
MQGVRALGESEGREELERQSETSAVQEGAAHDAGRARDPVSGVGVQALRGKPHPASDLESLDMHAGMDEPELLIDLLINIAETKARGGRAAWEIVGQCARECATKLEWANETPSRR